MTTACIRTSDRGSFRSCRRKWNWTSSLRDNLTFIEAYTPFWLGSGIHYGLEDWHGYNLFGSPSNALRGYAEACRRCPTVSLPDNWREALELGVEMLDYYLVWLETRDPLKTYWVDGIPQVEVRAQIPIPFKCSEYDRVVYDLTIDRVVEDENSSLWLIDYKSAQRFNTGHLDTDSQVTSYCWAGNVLYEKPIQGMVYQQHRKTEVVHPAILQSGLISTNKSQTTSHKLYKNALVNLYGSVDKAPAANVRCLNRLAEQETEDRDPFIRRDWIERSSHQMAAEGEKILLELSEMLNPDLPIYSSPGLFCGSCFFLGPCVALDNNDDWRGMLNDITRPDSEERDEWREYLRP